MKVWGGDIKCKIVWMFGKGDTWNLKYLERKLNLWKVKIFMTQSVYEEQGCCRTILFMFVVFMSECFNFSKSVLRVTISSTAISIFQKSFFRARKQFVAVSIFQNQDFVPQKHLGRFQYFHKPALTFEKRVRLVSIFQKSAFRASEILWVLNSISRPVLLSKSSLNSEMTRINNISDHFSYLLKIDLMEHKHILDE